MWIIFQNCTPLLIAVVHGHEQVVVELLRKGAKPDIMSDVSFINQMILQ